SDTLYSGSVSPAWSNSYYYIAPIAPVLDTGTEVDTLRGGAGYDMLFAGYGDHVDGGVDGGALLISFQGAGAGVVFDVSQLYNGGTVTIGGGTIVNISTVLWVDGTNFADTISGDVGNNSPDIRGFGGDDQLSLGYYGANLYGGEGNDILDARNSSYGGYLYGDAGNDTIYLGSATSAGFGGDGEDIFYGSGSMEGGAGNDIFNITMSFYSSTIFGDAGNDLVQGHDRNDTVYGGADADTIHGNGGNDRLFSAGARDSLGLFDDLDHGSERDRLFGGDGDDYMSIGFGDDADGGIGTNTLILSLAGASTGVTLNATALVGGSVTLGGGTITNVQVVPTIYGSAFDDQITLPTQSSLITVYGGAGADRLTAGGSGATLNGEGGDDILIGSDSADTIEGGEGLDVISGLGGNDVIRVQAGDTVVGETIDGGAGIDTVFLSSSFTTVDISGATFQSIEELSGYYIAATAAQIGALDYLSANSISLTTGGSLSLAGLTLYLRDGRITLSDFATVFDMTGVINGYGSAQPLIIDSGAGNDVITTLDTADTINGGGGDDVIHSGDGADQLAGGAGRDTFDAGAGDDRIFVAGADFVAGESYDGGEGDDTLTVSGIVDISSATLLSIERIFVDGFGSGLSMTGAQLAGIGYIDTRGYQVTLTTSGRIAYAGTGDSLRFSLAAADTEFDLSGVTSASSISVTGNNGNDTLIGSGLRDMLSGGAGNDRIDGGAGFDDMYGGTGDEIF
ncbi:MAG: calcium-binding protein, partial [Sphingomonadales bacterium]